MFMCVRVTLCVCARVGVYIREEYGPDLGMEALSEPPTSVIT
jgi:hypothetical protein